MLHDCMYILYTTKVIPNYTYPGVPPNPPIATAHFARFALAPLTGNKELPIPESGYGLDTAKILTIYYNNGHLSWIDYRMGGRALSHVVL